MPESNTPTNNLPEIDESYSIEIAIEHLLDVDVEQLRFVLETMLRDHRIREASISIAIVDDATIRTLNNSYLEHDYATDVLSFVFRADVQQNLVDGEIIASAETAERVAREIGVGVSDELFLYVMHGMLHLLGYGDQSRPERDAMRAAEQKYMMLARAEYCQPKEEES